MFAASLCPDIGIDQPGQRLAGKICTGDGCGLLRQRPAGKICTWGGCGLLRQRPAGKICISGNFIDFKAETAPHFSALAAKIVSRGRGPAENSAPAAVSASLRQRPRHLFLSYKAKSPPDGRAPGQTMKKNVPPAHSHASAGCVAANFFAARCDNMRAAHFLLYGELHRNFP